jgi:hypothetical protein
LVSEGKVINQMGIFERHLFGAGWIFEEASFLTVWRWGVPVCAYPVVIIDDAHAKHALQIPKVFQVRREPWAFSAAFLCSLPSGADMD